MKLKKCPKCGSSEVNLYMGSETGIKYECKDCGYIGPLVIEEETLKIKVIPNAKRNEIIEGKPLKVKVTAPARKGKANKAVEKLLSEHFGDKVKIVKGFKSRKKIVKML